MKNLLVLFLLLGSFAVTAQDSFSPNEEGYIRNWLILAPMISESEDGYAELNRQQIPNEAKLQPKNGDEVTVGNQKLKWTAHQTEKHFIDFKTFVKNGQSEQVAAYAVTYVVVEEEMKGIKLKMGSNDQGKVYVNGVKVVEFADTRTLESEDLSKEFTLNKGVNTIVFKVANQENNWQGSLRFVAANGNAIQNLKIKLTP